MYPSVLLLPLPMAGLAAYNHFCGPMQTIRLSASISAKILNFARKQKIISPKDISLELSVLDHLIPHRIMACLELSCAMQIWLALHGNSSHVVLGKRVENSQILAHAWLETSSEPFFFDDRFEPIMGTLRQEPGI